MNLKNKIRRVFNLPYTLMATNSSKYVIIEFLKREKTLPRINENLWQEHADFNNKNFHYFHIKSKLSF